MTTGMSRLYRFWKAVSPAISVRDVSLWRNTSANRSSFQTHSMLTTASVISGAPESGSTTRRKIWNADAPSISAASISDIGDRAEERRSM